MKALINEAILHYIKVHKMHPTGKWINKIYRLNQIHKQKTDQQ